MLNVLGAEQREREKSQEKIEMKGKALRFNRKAQNRGGKKKKKGEKKNLCNFAN